MAENGELREWARECLPELLQETFLGKRVVLRDTPSPNTVGSVRVFVGEAGGFRVLVVGPESITLKIGEELNRQKTLSPELKQFIDTVIVPALVKEYLAELASEKSACQEAEVVRESAATRTATVAEV